MHPWQQPEIIALSQQLAFSFQHWTKQNLISSVPEMVAHDLYHAPFVLVAHGMQPDPIFCYANLAAQTLWEMDWQQFTSLPSRLSAEPDVQGERERLLKRAQVQGFVDDYSGVRITSSGRRFKVRECILWNVVDETLAKKGQAARFDSWEWL